MKFIFSFAEIIRRILKSALSLFFGNKPRTITVYVTYRPKGLSAPVNQEAVELTEGQTGKDAKDAIYNKYGDVVPFWVSTQPDENIISRFIDWRNNADYRFNSMTIPNNASMSFDFNLNSGVSTPLKSITRCLPSG
jgi:hypothetical protein